MRPFKRVKMLEADEYHVLKRAVASRKIAAGKARRARRSCCSNQASPPARGLSTPPNSTFRWMCLYPVSRYCRQGKPMKGRIEMGKPIATTQATVDGVIDPVGEWVQADGDHADYSFERQARSSGLVKGRKTYEGLAGYWPSQSGKWADMVNSLPKYVGSRTLSGISRNATLLAGTSRNRS